MTLRLEDDWVWDSWPFDDDQGLHHLFFLKAPRSLGDPELRHINASVGHAVSSDYRAWEILPDVLGPAPEPAWDDGAIWTGSVVQAPNGGFHFFYTACSRADNYLVQRIGRADSDDLISWTRAGDQPLLEVDPRWYEIHDGRNWHDQAWRDPWVFADPDGNGWHMLITARSNSGAQFSRGVVGHAWSPDLDRWEVRPPLSQPGGFGQLEVMQLVPPGVVDAMPRLLFACGVKELDVNRHPADQPGGMWLATGAGMLGPWDIANARRIDHPTIYAAHVITDIDESPAVLGFDAGTGDGFGGFILDPVPLWADRDPGGRPVTDGG
jgi:beta-fructofuranosidase